METTGAALADKGVGGLKEMLEKIRKAGGGVLFVDEVRLGFGGRGTWCRVGCCIGAMMQRRNNFCVFLVGIANVVNTRYQT